MTLLKWCWRLSCISSQAVWTSLGCFVLICGEILNAPRYSCNQRVSLFHVFFMNSQEERDKEKTTSQLLTEGFWISLEDLAMLEFWYWTYDVVKTVVSRLVLVWVVFEKAPRLPFKIMHYNLKMHCLGDKTTKTQTSMCTTCTSTVI